MATHTISVFCDEDRLSISFMIFVKLKNYWDQMPTDPSMTAKFNEILIM